MLGQKHSKLSFGLDWGSQSVKLLGLKMVDSDFELTHCVLFDLPEQENQRQITALIRKRLQKINLHGGRLTISLPTNDVQFQLQPNQTSWSKWFSLLMQLMHLRRPDTAGERMEAKVSEDFVQEKWLPRLRLTHSLPRVEMEGLSLPVLDASPADKEVKIFLQIGYRYGRVTLVKGKDILAHEPLNFSLLNLLPAPVVHDMQKRKRSLALLQTAKISYKNRYWQLRTKESCEDLPDLFPYAEQQLQEFAQSLPELVNKYRAQYTLTTASVQLIGCGGMFPILETLVAEQLSLPVTKVQPFSRMVKIGADFNLGKLQRVEPLFAQAVALALAGAQRQDQPAANHDLSPKLRWLMPGIDSQVKKFRRVALGFSLLILLFTALTSLQLERKQQEYWTLNSKRQDLQQRIYLHQNSTLLNSWLMSTPQQLLNTQMPRASQILQVVGEIIPTGAWITQVQILPSDQIVEFKAIPKMPKVSVPVLIIEGRAVSSNFVGEFFNRLNDSGYFTQIILKRQDSRIDLSNSVGYSILAQIGNSHETRAVKN